MGIRTQDSVTISQRAVLAFDEGTGVFTISVDGTVVYTSATLTAAELAYLDIAALGTGAASKAVVLDAGEDYTWPATGIFTYGVLKDPAGTTINATGAEVNKLDDSAVVLTKGSGVSAAESYASGAMKIGSLVRTQICLDMTGLVGSATDVDIIGNTGGAANCHWGQITAALSGAIIGGRVTCLEVPAGGTADINFYSSSAATGAQDALASGLAGVATLIDAGGAWTSGLTKGMTALPTANDYLYLANGAASGGTFSAGKFLIELFGFSTAT